MGEIWELVKITSINSIPREVVGNMFGHVLNLNIDFFIKESRSVFIIFNDVTHLRWNSESGDIWEVCFKCPYNFDREK